MYINIKDRQKEDDSKKEDEHSRTRQKEERKEGTNKAL